MGKLREFLFHNRDTRQTMIKNAFWLSAGQMGSRLFRALIIIYAARVLGAAEYGIFSYVLGLAGFFTIFADVGINSILTRDVSKNPERGRYYFATSFWIKISLLFLTSILVVFVAPHFSKIEAARALIPLVALLTIFDGLREFSAAFFKGKEKMELEALLIISTNVAITVFGFVILYYSATAQALTLTYILSASVGTIIGFIILRKEFLSVIRFFRKELLRPIINSALPIAFLGILGIFMMNVDIIMLGYFRTASEIGFYAVSQRIIGLLFVIPSIIAATTFPALSRFISKKEWSKTKTLVGKSLTTVFLVTIPLVAGGIILGKEIIYFIFGSEYAASISTFKILIFSLLIVSPGMFIGNYILAHDKQKRMVPYFAVSSIMNVVLNVILIPLYGIIGAAIATVGAQFFFHVPIWLFAKRIRNFSIFGGLKKVVLATIIMSASVVLFKTLGIHVLINILISSAVYLGALIILKESVVYEIKNTLFNHGSK